MRLVACCAFACACGRVDFEVTTDAVATSDTAAITDPYGLAIVGDDPVAYWRFEERGGITVRDQIAGHVATLVGGCTLDVAGALTNAALRAVELDGSTCRIVAGDILDFVATPFTIELWARMDVSNGSVRWLVSHMDQSANNAGYAFLHQNTTLWVEHNNSGGGGTYIPSTRPSLGEFHHLAYTFRDGLQRIYIDGVIAGENVFTWTQPEVAAPLIFGDLVEANPNKFDGALDEIVFYDRELSQAELAAHFEAR